jgi:hypothetical protein
MKKKLDTASITNELEESSFFKNREKLSPEKAVESQKPKTEITSTPPPSKSRIKSKKPEADPQPNEQTQNNQGVRAYVRTSDAPVRSDSLLDLIPPTPEKRRPERYAFQFWEDQITRLKQLRKVMNLSKDADAREEISLSDMIREAVDDYIAKQIKLLKQSVRTGE